MANEERKIADRENKNWYKKAGYFVANYAPLPGPINPGNALSAYSAKKTYSHLSALKVMTTRSFHTCACDHAGQYGRACGAALHYAIEKKTKKLGKTAASAIPFVPTGMAIDGFSLVKAIYKKVKGTKGVNRKEHADNLHKGCREGCDRSRAIVTELCGEENVKTITRSPLGAKWIFEKLASV